MSTRQFATEIWTELEIEGFSDPMQKLLIIYCEKNNHAMPSGLYYISPTTISNETGISVQRVIKLLPTLSPRVLYDTTCCLLYARKALQGQYRSTTFLTYVSTSLKQIRPHPFLKRFSEDYKGLPIAYIQAIDSLSIDTHTLTHTLIDEIGGVGEREGSAPGPAKPVKKKFLDHVFLTGEEHEKLVASHGKELTARMVEAMNNYAHKIGPKKFQARYQSHYHTILTWIQKEQKERKDGGKHRTGQRPAAGKTEPAKKGPGKYAGIGEDLTTEG